MSLCAKASWCHPSLRGSSSGPTYSLITMDTHKLCGSPAISVTPKAPCPLSVLRLPLPSQLSSLSSPSSCAQPTRVLRAAFQLPPSTPPLARCPPLCMPAFGSMFASWESLCHLPGSLNLVSFTWRTHMATQLGRCAQSKAEGMVKGTGTCGV